ncbi:putative cytochrome P450 [Helianthus annuus]|uniref:Cytochrome P450 n=2 Tax=Helianthus annuus TaxID=4232 RepID=A0A9K3HLC9_HELAN|nr:putative cytochrome P450 [Helianthus annuus]KAJ0500222.1 putative cytochrome P450 [Helianthus annuus]KAJ0507585.1 putative cytochrome P450 [Helianthus annuus]KAJ0516054.1 putative cytochrome P450 [Helianthus annuus]KAJ0684071.1 putative cytochrome P450 [Helianthus annuus]
MGWPLIGNMLIVEDGSTHPLWLSPLGRNGGIFHIKMGFSHTIVVSSPEMAREILQVQDHIFANRPATIAITYLTYNRVDMAFADYGPFWRQMRKLSVMKLFSRKRAESWDSVLDEVDSMVKSTLVNSGSLVNLGELVFGLTHDIISRALSGLFLMKVKRRCNVWWYGDSGVRHTMGNDRANAYSRSIKATLRLHPPIPVALHKSSADTMVIGYHIPKGARVMVNAYAINRDKNSWEDPNTFNPSLLAFYQRLQQWYFQVQR